MSTPTLWTIPGQPKGKAVRATATMAGVPFTLPENYEHFKTNKEPEFVAKFPFGKIPAWEEDVDGQKFLLAEADAIIRYIAAKAPQSGLLGNTPQEAALVDQFSHIADAEVDVWTSFVRAVTSGTVVQGYSKPAHTYALQRQLRAVKFLDAHLASHTYFVGERITTADLVVAALIQQATKFTLGAEERKELPNLIRHLETIVNQPKLKEIYGPLEYTEKSIQFTPPAKEKAPKEKAKAEKAPKAEKPKEEKKPKKKEVEEDEDDDLGVPEEPKKKNPLDDLPKSTFNLEDWKRAYSNMDTRGPGGSLEWFYKNFDASGFSIWRVNFKYNSELTQTFMSSNQIGGFFNRLEASRKYLFASVGVLGKANDSIITGVLILRGPAVEPVVEVAPDWESYEYTPISLEDEKDKSFFEGALAWDLEVDGRAWVDGKNFK